MNLSVADVGVALEGLPDAFEAQARSRYSAFLVDSENAPELRINVTLDDTIEPVPIGDDDPPLVRVARDAGDSRVIHLRRDDNPFRAVIDFSSCSGEVVCAANPYCFDSFLRVLYSVLLAERGGVLLHTVAVGSCAGAGVKLLVGASEAGKTTASRQGFGFVLGDELVAVVRDGAGFVAHGTPFWGEFTPGKINARERVSDLYLLRKGPSERVEPVAGARAALEVLGCTFFFGPPERSAEQLATIVDLVAATGRGELYCTPTPAVVDFLYPDAVKEVAGV